MKKSQIIIMLIMLLLIAACEDIFEYSPYVIDFDDHETNLTQKNIDRLLSTEMPDTIIIALTGDSHRFYDESERMVNKINNEYDIDFLIHNGDFSDYGIPQQYQWTNDIFSALNAPYFVVIGNHDLVSNGEESYKEMFGSLNFSFIYGSYKFIFINTNSREYEYYGNVPDIDWLNQEIIPSNNLEKAIIVFHTPPYDSGFSSDLETEFMRTLHKYENVLFVTHGHLHNFSITEPYNDSIQFINTPSVDKKKFVLVKIFNNQFTTDVKTF